MAHLHLLHPLTGAAGAGQVSRLVNYPVNGFVVEGGDMEEVAALVGRACVLMQQQNIPHNLLITDSGARVFIWPQVGHWSHPQGRLGRGRGGVGGRVM